MKLTVFLFCILSAGAAFGQAIGSASLSIENNPLSFANHKRRATQHALGDSQVIMERYDANFGQGNRPLWEFAPPEDTTPLGDIARMYKKEHETAKKATFVWEKE